MKKIIAAVLLAIGTLPSYAQGSANLSENFDVACVAVTLIPNNWFVLNRFPATYLHGAWTCDPQEGVGNSPCMNVTNYYDESFHLDTAFLATPLLNLSSYAGQNVYMRFDTKSKNIHVGGRLHILLEQGIVDPSFGVGSFTDLTTYSTPVIGKTDSNGWSTHQIDLTPYISLANFHCGFRYTADDTSGSIWYIDNVNITTAPLGTPIENKVETNMDLTILGHATTNNLSISFNSSSVGRCHLIIADLSGRTLYNEELKTLRGKEVRTLNNLNLLPGMYFIKITDGQASGFAKVVIN